MIGQFLERDMGQRAVARAGRRHEFQLHQVLVAPAGLLPASQPQRAAKGTGRSPGPPRTGS